MTLELEARRHPEGNYSAKDQSIVIGFAAETENVLENARQKLAAKHLDAIVVNDVPAKALVLTPNAMR